MFRLLGSESLPTSEPGKEGAILAKLLAHEILSVQTANGAVPRMDMGPFLKSCVQWPCRVYQK